MCSVICDHCNTAYPSRNALFRHLESIGVDIRPQGKKKRVANCAFQLGYHWSEEVTREEAVDNTLGSRLEGVEILWRIGAPNGHQGVYARAPGSPAWCDIVCGFDVEKKSIMNDDWIHRANQILLVRGKQFGVHVCILRVVAVSAALTAETVAWSRVEVTLPRAIVCDSNDDDDDVARDLRDTANQVLCRGNTVSWHSFGDAISGYRPPCPGDENCRAGLRRVDCSQDEEKQVFRIAITAEGLQLRLAASRAVALAVAVHCKWLTLEASRAAFSKNLLWFAHAPRPPPRAEMLASVSFGPREVKANACVDALRIGPSTTVENFRSRVRSLVHIDECIHFWNQFEHWCRSGTIQTKNILSSPKFVPNENLTFAYEKALTALRQLRRDGWPTTTPARAARLQATCSGAGGSFSIGVTPEGQAPPRNNTLAHLVTAVFDLEKLLLSTIPFLQGRQTSKMCAVNFDALFLPHVDTGSAGGGQSNSLFVTLGDFCGGELIVEGIAHDCRYKPLLFDANSKRHWTAPFTGERFSLVWFTPHGTIDSEIFHDQVPQFIEGPLTLVRSMTKEFTTGLNRRSKRFVFACNKFNLSVSVNPQSGVALCREFLSAQESIQLLKMLDSLKLNFVKPRYLNGQTLRCRVACLGRRWNHHSQCYEDDATPLPQALLKFARRAAQACKVIDPSIMGNTEKYADPDVCILNFYDDTEHRAGMGLHQDIAEDPGVIARGDPVISLSIGSSALFVLADTRDAYPNDRTRLRLDSGDVLAFGGASRVVFHGVEQIAPFFLKDGKAPDGMYPGRLNLTFRKSKT